MLWDSFAFTGRGIYAPKPVFETGSWVVVAVFILSIIGVFAYRRYAKLRYIPMVVICRADGLACDFVCPCHFGLFVMGNPIGLEYPELKGFNFKGGIWARGSFVALTFALAIYTVPLSRKTCVQVSLRFLRVRQRPPRHWVFARAVS